MLKKCESNRRRNNHYGMNIEYAVQEKSTVSCLFRRNYKYFLFITGLGGYNCLLFINCVIPKLDSCNESKGVRASPSNVQKVKISAGQGITRKEKGKEIGL